MQVGRKVASDVVSLGAEMVDAPVSGGKLKRVSIGAVAELHWYLGVTRAKARTLSFLVGGSAIGFSLANPFLVRMGKNIFHCGPSGSGLAAKICNNLVLGVEQIVVAEAMLLGQRLGLNPAILAGVINSSTGACWSSSVNNPVVGALPDKAPPCEREYEGRFSKMKFDCWTQLMSLVQGGFATALMIKVSDSSSAPSWAVIPVC